MSIVNISKNSRPLIGYCAITSSAHTPAMSAYLPITATQTVDSSRETAEAGTAALPLHAHAAECGKSWRDREQFQRICPILPERAHAIIVTTGGSIQVSVEDRLAYRPQAKPEMCSLNMGSMRSPARRDATARAIGVDGNVEYPQTEAVVLRFTHEVRF